MTNPSRDDERARTAYIQGARFINRARRVRRWITGALWVVVVCVALGLVIKVFVVH